MHRPVRQPGVSGGSPPETKGLSVLMVAALAVGAAGFGFGTFFYLVPYQRKSAQVERLSKEVQAARTAAATPRKSPTEERNERIAADLAALRADIDRQLAAASPVVTLGTNRLRISFSEERLFDARGPWLSKPGQETLQTLGELLGSRAGRVVIAAPMGSATVPRWVKAQLPTPADLSAARAGNALKALVKGGVRAQTVFAVIGSLGSDDPNAPATLDLDVEP